MWPNNDIIICRKYGISSVGLASCRETEFPVREGAKTVLSGLAWQSVATPKRFSYARGG